MNTSTIRYDTTYLRAL